jgi:hypothetical protein
MNVAGRPIQLGNHELSFVLLAGGQGLSSSGRSDACLTHFDELAEQLALAAIEIVHDGFAPRGRAVAIGALAFGADAEVGDRAAVRSAQPRW